MNTKRRSRFNPATTETLSFEPSKSSGAARNPEKRSSGLTEDEEAVATLITVYVSYFPLSTAQKLFSHIVDPVAFKNGATIESINKGELAALIDIAVSDYLDAIEEDVVSNDNDGFFLQELDMNLVNEISNISGEKFIKTASDDFFCFILALAVQISQC